jgi:hypothetical protein
MGMSGGATCVCLQEDEIEGGKVVGLIRWWAYTVVCVEKDRQRYMFITLYLENEFEVDSYIFGFDCEHPGEMFGKPIICCDKERSRLCEAALTAASKCWGEKRA